MISGSKGYNTLFATKPNNAQIYIEKISCATIFKKIYILTPFQRGQDGNFDIYYIR